jgi:hypothetical protein
LKMSTQDSYKNNVCLGAKSTRRNASAELRE